MLSYPYPAKDSPVEARRKELPRGNGEYPGRDVVQKRLRDAAEFLSSNRYTLCNQDHVETMAVMGTGHEETEKYWAGVCITYGWCKVG